MNTQTTIVGLMLLVASACATSAKQLPASADSAPAAGLAIASTSNGTTKGKTYPEKKIVCETELLVGSHIPQRVCRDVVQVESERQELQNALERRPLTQPRGD